ncbi:MAG TPA: O-antigen ligase family protein [Elusimicrobiales bacterium]|nr:O-antigen ligase family protein [Elusimicrobiales bacterium]
MEKSLYKIGSDIDCRMGTLFGLCIFAFGLTLSVSITEIGIGIAFICWILRLKKTDFQNFNLRNFAAKTPLLLPWSVYIAIAVITGVLGLNIVRSINYLPSDLIKMAACLFLVATMDKEMIKPVMGFYLLGASIASVWAITQVANYYSTAGALVRTGATMNIITFGETISFALLAVIVLFAKTPKKNKFRYIFLAQIFLFGAVLLLSQSRGAMLGAVVSVMLLWIMERHIRKFLTVLAVSAVFVIAALSFKSPRFADRFFSVPKAVYKIVTKPFVKTDVNLTEEIQKLSSSRIGQWKAGIKMLGDYPILGVGPSNVKVIFHFYHPKPIDGQYGWSNLHNLYLHQAVERGLVGLAALIYLLTGIFILAWKSNKTKRNVYTIWCLCVLPGFFVMNLTETSFQHAVVSMSIFFMLAASHKSSAVNY